MHDFCGLYLRYMHVMWTITIHHGLDLKGKRNMLPELAINGLLCYNTAHDRVIDNECHWGQGGMQWPGPLTGPALGHAAYRMITLTLSHKISTMKNGSFPGLNVLQRLLWPMLLPETMLGSMTRVAARDQPW